MLSVLISWQFVMFPVKCFLNDIKKPFMGFLNQDRVEMWGYPERLSMMLISRNSRNSLELYTQFDMKYHNLLDITSPWKKTILFWMHQDKICVEHNSLNTTIFWAFFIGFFCFCNPHASFVQTAFIRWRFNLSRLSLTLAFMFFQTFSNLITSFFPSSLLPMLNFILCTPLWDQIYFKTG